ncbi:hypothetical protein BOTBODRAFT_130203, partial [Botryobasidium botryosum FD-172 SS1]
MIKFSQPELEKLEHTLNAGKAVEARESEWPHRTRLHRALYDGDLARAKLLLGFGADPNAQDADSQRPMHIVTESDHMAFVDEETRADMIESLLAAGADMDAKDDDGDTPLSLAYREGRPYCVRALVDAGADPSISGEWGAPTPTFVVELIRNPDGAEVVANVLAAGAGVNAKDDRGYTLLDRAAFCGSPSAVRALLDAGADPNVETNLPSLCSAAVLMKSDGGEKAVVALLSAGADVDMHSFYDKRGPSPLHGASERGYASTVRLLLESGADPDLRNRGGQRALHVALPGRDCTVSALLEAGADPNARDNQEETPLHYAI